MFSKLFGTLFCYYTGTKPKMYCLKVHTIGINLHYFKAKFLENLAAIILNKKNEI